MPRTAEIPSNHAVFLLPLTGIYTSNPSSSLLLYSLQLTTTSPFTLTQNQTHHPTSLPQISHHSEHRYDSLVTGMTSLIMTTPPYAISREDQYTSTSSRIVVAPQLAPPAQYSTAQHNFKPQVSHSRYPLSTPIAQHSAVNAPFTYYQHLKPIYHQQPAHVNAPCTAHALAHTTGAIDLASPKPTRQSQGSH